MDRPARRSVRIGVVRYFFIALILPTVKNRQPIPVPPPCAAIRAPLHRILVPTLLSCAMAAAYGQSDDNVEFNAGFLHQSGTQAVADLALFKKANHVLPGSRLVDLYLNLSRVGSRSIRFGTVRGDAGGDALPCIDKALLISLGVNVKAFTRLDQASPNTCLDLARAIPSAGVSFDAATQKLSLSIPQAALTDIARGAIDVKQWSRGINAAFANYQINASNNAGGQQGDSNQMYLGLQSGINFDGWRVRSSVSYDRESHDTGHWQTINSYAQHDVTPLLGQLTVGDSYTPANVFDTIQFRGVQLASDNSMLPDSLQGFAPTIRGVANSNAKVSVKQNGYVIYSTYVAPGPFVINDIYPSGSSGDLQVTITEADGSVRSYIQPYESIPQMLRAGTWNYDVVAGRYRSGEVQAMPNFVQGSLAYGLPHNITLYGGLTGASFYKAAAFGVAKVMGEFGALSADVTYAQSTDWQQHASTGQSIRLLYAKTLQATDTTLRLAGYRYSSSGYRTFDEAVQQSQFSGLENTDRHARVELSLQQNLWGSSSVSLMVGQQSYWNGVGSDKLIQVGLNTTYKGVGINLFLSNTDSLGDASSKQVSLSLSFPLGRIGKQHQAFATYAMSDDRATGALSQQAGVSGTLLQQQNLNYSVQAANANQGQGAAGTASLDYRGGDGEISGGYSYGSQYRQANLSASGGILLHAHGITLAQPLQETSVLVEAPGAASVGIENYPGVKTDRAGYAVVPYAQPYRYNRIALHAEDLDKYTSIDDTAEQVVPRRGAIVAAPFTVVRGRSALIYATLGAQHTVLPLGANVYNMQNKAVGVVGNRGATFVPGLTQHSSLTVKWGKGDQQQCQMEVDLPKDNHDGLAYETVSAECVVSHSQRLARLPVVAPIVAPMAMQPAAATTQAMPVEATRTKSALSVIVPSSDMPAPVARVQPDRQASVGPEQLSRQSMPVILR